MKQIILALFYVSILVLSACSEPKETAKDFYSVEELQQDFDIFKNSLEEGHPALYRYISKTELDSVFANARSSITKPMTDREFMILLCKVAVRIGDGHLRVIPPKVHLDKLDESATAIPFQVYLNENKLFVRRNYSI